MELAVGAMASLAPKLGGLLMDEYVVRKGLKPDIESLSLELLAVNAALVDASRVPPDQLSELDKLWALQVRELSYDMEDAVDDFVLRVAAAGRGSAAAADANNVFKKMVGKVTAAARKVKDRHKISDKVKDIKKLSSELAELRAKYTVRGAGANRAASTGIDPRVLNLYRKESDLVGIDKSRDTVIRMLTGTKDGHAHDGRRASEQSLKIVCIVGVGGLGKTTLTKTVYDRLRNDFSCSAFVSVGRTPDIPRTFEKILVGFDQEKYSQVDMARWDIERLCNELHGFLHDRRYFIIVDDIWDKESWESIKYVLKDNNCGSALIMTTRNSEVVMKGEEVYKLKPLSDKNSKELFQKRIQSQEGESIDDLSAEVSSKIISKCGGLPLAIIAVASLLVDKPYEDWLKVYDSIGFGNEDDRTKKILSYSYYDLPSYLKPCLLHLGIFPEDSILEANKVVWMWIGEGFVLLEKEEDSLFEIGERYFKELINRSMIESVENKFDRLTQHFRIHDIVFDLIRELLRAENFCTILGRREQQASSDSSLRRQKKTSMPHSSSKVRRLSVQSHHAQHIPEDIMEKSEVLRSLNIVDSTIESMAPFDMSNFCRVLNIQNSNIPIDLLFKHMGRLLHLKYIMISDIWFDELPKEIGHLISLQTLIVRASYGLRELPPAVCMLTQLMCLVVEGWCERLPADKMGNLIFLEELRLHSVQGQSTIEDLVVELGKLTRLRVVSICFKEKLEESMQKALVQSLCNLRELQGLELYFDVQTAATTIWEGWEPPSNKLRRLFIKRIKFQRLPRWIDCTCLRRICSLSLDVYAVELQDLNNLARLPELCHLDLVGGSWPSGYTVGTDGFKNLRFCAVGTSLKFDVGAMPRLEKLQFVVHEGYWCFEVDGVLLEQFPTKDVIGDLDFGLDNLLPLEQVTVQFDCWGATAAEVLEVEAVVRRAVENHPNRPTVMMDRWSTDRMLSDEHREALVRRRLSLRLCFTLCMHDRFTQQQSTGTSFRPRLETAVFQNPS